MRIYIIGNDGITLRTRFRQWTNAVESYGHAIGHAAALAVKEKVAPRDISGRDLRLILNRDGARLD